MAKMQTLVLDAVAPLVHILEIAQSGNLIIIDTSVKAVKLALRLLANASAHISKERRKTSLKDLNRPSDPHRGRRHVCRCGSNALWGRFRKKHEGTRGSDEVHQGDIEQQDRAVFSEGPPPGPISPSLLWGWQQLERKRQIPPVPKQQLQQPGCWKRTSERRARPTSKTSKDSQSRDTDSPNTRDCVCIYKPTDTVNPARLTTFLPTYIKQ